MYFDHRFQMIGWGPAIKKENVFQKVAESLDKLFAREHRPSHLEGEEEEEVYDGSTTV